MNAIRLQHVVFALPCALTAVACNSLLDNSSATLQSDDTEADSGIPQVDAAMADLPETGATDSFVPMMDASPPEDAGNGCAAGEKMCAGTCVKITDPVYGCSPNTCTACMVKRSTAVCIGGSCAVGTCDPGYADCNKNAADGCETDLSSPSSCGSCNGMCGAAAPNCTPVGPTFQCATGCGADAPLLCGKQCVDPMTSVNHCGSCNVACPAVPHGTPVCTGGACDFTCSPQFHACSATKTCAADTDPTACGPTCTACPAEPSAVVACRSNACAYTCNAGTADCDAMPANGCEATLASDPKNCGACGVVCPSTCTKGKCDAVMDAGSDGG
jgi:hypothetical protein